MPDRAFEAARAAAKLDEEFARYEARQRALESRIATAERRMDELDGRFTPARTPVADPRPGVYGGQRHDA